MAEQEDYIYNEYGTFPLATVEQPSPLGRLHTALSQQHFKESKRRQQEPWTR